MHNTKYYKNSSLVVFNIISASYTGLSAAIKLSELHPNQ